MHLLDFKVEMFASWKTPRGRPGTDGSGDYTGFDIDVYDVGAFSASILCYHETYMYQCPL